MRYEAKILARVRETKMVAIQAANVDAVMYIRVSYTSAIKVMGTPAKPMGQKLSVQIAPVQLLFPSIVSKCSFCCSRIRHQLRWRMQEDK